MLISFAAALLSMAACKSHNRTDAQVASDIQTRLNADQAVHNKQIAVLAANGVVTLSGSVNSDAERSAVASDAASVNGVRTVVNNLTVQPADASADQNEPQSPAWWISSLLPPRVRRLLLDPRPSPAPHDKTETTRLPDRTMLRLPRPMPCGSSKIRLEPAQTQQARRQPPAPAPPPPTNITIPDGTVFAVRMSDTLDSETANPGESFRAMLNSRGPGGRRAAHPSHARFFLASRRCSCRGPIQRSGLLTIEITKVEF